MFWPPDSHWTIAHGIAHGPPGPAEETAARARAASRLPQLALGAAAAGAGAAERGERGRRGRGAASSRRSRRPAVMPASASRRARTGGGLALAALGQRGVALLLAVGLRARGAHDAEQPRVGALDAAHEAQRLQQLREAVGVQHDGDEVRAVAHVALAQQAGELLAHLREPLAQAVHALAGLDEPACRERELARRRC